jgi:hypothetical protein
LVLLQEFLGSLSRLLVKFFRNGVEAILPTESAAPTSNGCQVLSHGEGASNDPLLRFSGGVRSVTVSRRCRRDQTLPRLLILLLLLLLDAVLQDRVTLGIALGPSASDPLPVDGSGSPSPV